MITFATLFLGLFAGARPVEMMVDDPVVRVELRLDGESAGVLEGPPWRLDVSFGSSLFPHRLEATGFDQAGEEIARVEQWINLPRARAEADMIVADEDDGKVVRLVWSSLEHQRPRQVDVLLDGQPLLPLGRRRFRLPDYDPEALHILSAEVVFADNAQVRVDRALGGLYGDESMVLMTAVPVRSKRRGSAPSPSSIDNRILVQGQPAKIMATESAGFDVVVVMDPSAHANLAVYSRTFDDNPQVDTNPHVALDDGETVRFVAAVPTRRGEGEERADLYPISRPFTSTDGLFHRLLTHATFGALEGAPRFADAVATAGVEAAAGGRPRAVVLVLGPDQRDESAFTVKEVRAYLRTLHVPLIVWSVQFTPTKRVSEDRIPIITKTPWGTAPNIISGTRLLEAIGDLRGVLSNQLVVWIEGSHLPQEVTLAETRGVELVQ